MSIEAHKLHMVGFASMRVAEKPTRFDQKKYVFCHLSRCARTSSCVCACSSCHWLQFLAFSFTAILISCSNDAARLCYAPPIVGCFSQRPCRGSFARNNVTTNHAVLLFGWWWPGIFPTLVSSRLAKFKNATDAKAWCKVSGQ